MPVKSLLFSLERNLATCGVNGQLIANISQVLVLTTRKGKKKLI